MSATVTLFTDRVGFEPLWRPALEQHGLTVRVNAPVELAAAVEPHASVIVDAASDAYDEDEILTALGFTRALGALPIAHMPDAGAMSAVDDLVDEMCGGLVARSNSDVPRLAAAVARRIDTARSRRFEFVTVSPREGEILAVLGDGHASLLKRPLDDSDGGGEVVQITLGDDASTAVLELTDGRTLALTAAAVGVRREGRLLNGGNGVGSVDGTRLGARLRELRLAAGLTQAELARRTGIHRPNIARVEAGRHTPSLDTLTRLASAIGVSATRVLSGD